VPRALADEDFGPVAVPFDSLDRDSSALARRLATRPAGDRIDDDCD